MGQQQVMLHADYQNSMRLRVAELLLNPQKMIFQKTGPAFAVLIVNQCEQPHGVVQRDNIGRGAQMRLKHADCLLWPKVIIKIIERFARKRRHVMENHIPVISAGVAVAAPIMRGGNQI